MHKTSFWFHCYIPFTSHRGAKARSHGCAESAQDIEMGKVEEVEATREGSRSAHKQFHSPKREGAGKASQEQGVAGQWGYTPEQQEGEMMKRGRSSKRGMREPRKMV